MIYPLSTFIGRAEGEEVASPSNAIQPQCHDYECMSNKSLSTIEYLQTIGAP